MYRLYRRAFQNLSGSAVVSRLKARSAQAPEQARSLNFRARMMVCSAASVIGLCGVGLLAAATAHAQTPASVSSGAVDASDSLYGTTSATIRDLLRTARRQVGMQQLEAAGITLERALAIEPANAVLWNALARLRYRQAGYREVQSLTLRSESLADGNAELVLRNRQLAAAAEQAIAGNVVPIVDLDLQTPNATILNSPSVVSGHSGSALPGATGGARIDRPTVIQAQPLPRPQSSAQSTAPQRLPTELPRVMPSPGVQSSGSVSGSTVMTPNVVGNTTVYNVPPPSTTLPSDRVAVVVAPPAPSAAPMPTTSAPTWTQQRTAVTPAPAPSAPTLASSSGIEERSFNHYGRGGRGVPRQYLPPPGMCRLWFDSRNAAEQPSPADCRTLRRNVPQGARLIVGEHRYSWEPFKIRN